MTFHNTITLTMISADMDRVIDTMIKNGISLSNINRLDDYSFEFSISKNDYFKIKRLIKPQLGEVLHIQRSGISTSVKKIILRPLLLIGLVLYFVASIYIQKTVLNIQVVGNNAIESKRIIECANNNGLYIGSSRKTLRSEQLKNALLEQIPELQWVGINTRGCVATINVQERITQNTQTPVNTEPGSMVAICDGTIRSVIATKGTVQCKVGDHVTKGQVLVHGYTDCGLALLISRAQGEVFADTTRQIQILTLNNSIKRSEYSGTEQRYSVIFGKKLIKLYKDSGILDATCVKIYKEYNILLPGGIKLPIRIINETIEYHHLENESDFLTEPAWLISRADHYIVSRMIAGKINEKNHSFFTNAVYCGYSLNYSCTEMIGKIQKEEILDLYG